MKRAKEIAEESSVSDVERCFAIALSSPKCQHCRGLGLDRFKTDPEVCVCVWRAVYRLSVQRAEDYENRSLGASVTLKLVRTGGITQARPYSEFLIDMHNAARRVLTPEEFSVFKNRNRDWHHHTRQLKIDRGAYFHLKYRMEEKLGRELARVGLYPGDYYITEGVLATERLGIPTQCRKAA